MIDLLLLDFPDFTRTPDVFGVFNEPLWTLKELRDLTYSEEVPCKRDPKW